MHVGELMQLLSGSLYSAIVCATAELRIAEALADGPHTAAEVARRCGAHPDRVHRLLRALVVLGLVGAADESPPPNDNRDSLFAETPTLRWLRDDADGSLRPLALMAGEATFQVAWGRLAESVRTGRTGFELAHARPLFAYLDGDDRLRDLFQRSLTGPLEWNQAIVSAIDVGDRRLAVDVGAGNGRLLRALLAANPHLRGVAFERPSVVQEYAAAPPVERLSWAAGDFFEALPAGGDLYLLRWVLHDWPDEQAVAILGNCRKALADGGAVLVVENLLDDGAAAALLDVSMLILTGGRERTQAEYTALLDRAGLRLDRTIATSAGIKVLVAGAR